LEGGGGGRLGRAVKQQDGHPHGTPPPPVVVELFRMAPETAHTRTQETRKKRKQKKQTKKSGPSAKIFF
jgi:hypothetical protein